MVDLASLGQTIQRRREANCLSRRQLAAISGFDAAYLGRVEQGRGDPGWVWLNKLAVALETPVSTLAHGFPLGRPDPVERQQAVVPIPASHVAAALRGLRIARRLTVEELAWRATLHRTTVDKIEACRRQPRWSTLCALAVGLDLTLAAFLGHIEPDRGWEAP